MVHLRLPSAVRRIALLLSIAVLAPGLAGCGSDDDGTTTTSTSAAATTETAATASDDACTRVAAAEPRSGESDQSKPKQSLASGTWTVSMTTNCGPLTIRLDTKRQPKTAASFAQLVKSGFYDGLSFHRIADGFVIQGGDPLGNGTGGPGYKVVESPPKDAAYTHGVVAMAKGGDEKAGTSGSQFFIVTAEDAGLPPDYAIVGEVTKGEDTVARIAGEGTGGDGPPAMPIVISKATLAQR